MSEKNFCFHARVGSDRYRLALLALYPQVLQLREIVKRLAVLHASETNTELLDGNATVVCERPENEILKRLRKIESKFENAWIITLESAGVLSNSFAPYPSENCNGEISKTYSGLWSRSDALFFQGLETLKNCFLHCFNQLKQLPNNDEQDLSCVDQQPNEIRQLYKETRQMESKDTRLKESSLQSITMETQDQPAIELIFPVSTSRLFM